MSSDVPQGATRITPYLTVRDMEIASDFYQKNFGFEVTELIPDKEGKPLHIGMTLSGETVVMFTRENGWMPMQSPATSGNPVPVSFYVYCKDVNEFTEHARNAGARVLAEPEDMFWGDRTARFEDPDGYQWTFATKVSEFDEGMMQAFLDQMV